MKTKLMSLATGLFVLLTMVSFGSCTDDGTSRTYSIKSENFQTVATPASAGTTTIVNVDSLKSAFTTQLAQYTASFGDQTFTRSGNKTVTDLAAVARYTTYVGLVKAFVPTFISAAKNKGIDITVSFDVVLKCDGETLQTTPINSAQ